MAKAKLPIMDQVPFDQRWTRKVSTFLSHGQCDRPKSQIALKKANALTVGHANRLGKSSPARPEIRVLTERDSTRWPEYIILHSKRNPGGVRERPFERRTPLTISESLSK
jgi:hypothetical protein